MKRRRKLSEKKKILKIINIIIFICFLLLLFEMGYGVYSMFFKEKKNIYFDGINSVIKIDKGYASVGSNNNNDNYYERAKFTIYNFKREKTAEKVYNKGFNSAYFDLCMTEDDGYVVVGSYEATNDEHKKSIREALIVKYDNKGNIEFEDNYKVLSNSKFTSVINVSDGYIAVGQSIYENTEVGNSKNGGAIIVKYNLDGNIVWKKSFGNSKTAIFNDVILYNDYLYVVGKNDNRLGIINKYDLEGNLISTNDYKYTDALGFTGIVELNDYLYVSTGKRITTTDTDAMIVKYDTDLTYIKEESYNGGSVERFNKVITDSKDHIILIGNSTYSNDKDHESDGLIAKYDDNLDKIAVVTYGDDRDDYFNGIINDVEHSYLVVGYSSSEDGSYYSKFIKYSDALKVLVTE